MCRTTDYYHHHHRENHRYLRLKPISLRLSLSSSTTVSHLPESLTLVFLPRINNTLLQINSSIFRPNSTAFISLHRVLHSDVVFASTDRILACDGVVFEIYAGDNRLLRGVFRRHNDGVFKMECKSVYVENELGVREVEVCVAEENGVVLKENVVVKKRRGCRRRRFAVALAEIPEERECDVVEEQEEEEGLSEVGCCCCGEGEGEGEVDEMMEGVGWAVDIGIWAVCLGVGLLVSRASARSLRRRKFLV